MYQLWWDRSWVGKKHIRNSIEAVERHNPRPQPYPRKKSTKKMVEKSVFLSKKNNMYTKYIFFEPIPLPQGPPRTKAGVGWLALGYGITVKK